MDRCRLEQRRTLIVLPAARAVAVSILRASTVYGLSNLGIRRPQLPAAARIYTFSDPDDYGTIALAETLAVLLTTVVEWASMRLSNAFTLACGE